MKQGGVVYIATCRLQPANPFVPLLQPLAGLEHKLAELVWQHIQEEAAKERERVRENAFYTIVTHVQEC